MKLEIEKVTEIGKEPWYRLLKDGDYVTGSYSLLWIEEQFESMKNGVPNKYSEILRSEEIDLPL